MGGVVVLRFMLYCIDLLGVNLDIVDFMDRFLLLNFWYGIYNNDIYVLFIYEDMIKIKIEWNIIFVKFLCF